MRKRPPKKIEAVPPAPFQPPEPESVAAHEPPATHRDLLAELLAGQHAQAEEYRRAIEPPRTTP